MFLIKMYQALILFQFLCIVLDYSFCLPADQLKVVHQCRCQSDDKNCTLKLCCKSDLSKGNEWIGLTAFGFGWFENTRNCSSEASCAGNSSFVLDQRKDNCSKTLSTYASTIDSVTGFELGFIKNIFKRCSSSPDYFIVHYFCVLKKTKATEDIIIGETCQRNIPNTQSVSIYSPRFPHLDINTTFRSCDCTLSTNASVLVVQTYSNRLYVNQTLTLTHKNGTVIKQWKKPGNIDEMLGNDTIPVSNSEVRLKWHNKASENGGKLWIVIEVSNDAEYIKVVCDQNISTTSSSMTNALTTTTATTTTWLPNTTQGPSTSTAEIWNSSYFTQSLSTLTEMNITSTSSSPDTTHLTRSSTTSVSNMTHPAKPLTSGTSNSTRVSSMAHHSEVTKNPTSNGKVNLGMIIGAACAIVLFLFILILCLVIWCKKKKQQVNPTSSQPSNSRFKQEHGARETPGCTEDNTLHNNTNKLSPATNSSSIYRTRLPPLPTGKYVNHASTKDGLRNFNTNESIDEEENEETSNHERYNTVIDNIFGNRPGNKLSPATNSSSIYRTRLPPLPTGKYVNHLSTKDGLRNFNTNESVDEEENEETSNHERYNTAIYDTFRNRPGNTDENPYTGSVERKTAKDLVSNRHETFEMQADGDENRDNGKKKPRKKKKWLVQKKQNMTEPLLDLTKETQDS